MGNSGPMTPPHSSNNTGIDQHVFQQLSHFNNSTSFPRDGLLQFDSSTELRSTPQASLPTPEMSYYDDGYVGQQSVAYTYGGNVGLGISDDAYQNYGHYPVPNAPMYPGQFEGFAPSPTPSHSGAIRTRSGLKVNRNVRPSIEARSKVAKAPKPAKKPKGKAEKRLPKLTEPLSVLTKDFTHVPVIDIEAYVNRSAEVRRREVDEGKAPGKVKRPMNSFMLYRKAWQNRTKEWCLLNNHQVVSQVCGDSWPLEPEEMREQFNEWARIERANHQAAHPGYKFSPSKPGLSKKDLKNKASEEAESEESDLEDWDYQGGRQTTRSKRTTRGKRVDPDEAYRPSPGPYDYGSRESSMDPNIHYQPQHHTSSYQANNPGKQLPAPYNQHMNGHHYETGIYHGPIPGSEDLVLHSSGAPAQQYVDSLPSNYQMLQYHQQQQIAPAQPQMDIDPRLFGGVYNDPYQNTPAATSMSGFISPNDLHDNPTFVNAQQDQQLQILKSQQLDQWDIRPDEPDLDYDKLFGEDMR